ncbi:MAG: tyrosine-type recombinase/integrase, partial [Acidobacteria bacterium]|nr:tyrosine-type recombinase/integrase [Acidobacteriota bacterium]
MGHSSKERQTMLLSTLITQYADYLRTAQPLSLATAQNYLCRVRRLGDALDPEANLPDLTRAALLRHIHRVGNASPHAVRMHYAAIRHFCRWLIAEGWLRVSPAEGIPLPKAPRRRRETVPDDAVARLMEACDRLPRNEYRRILAKAALSLLVYGGLRRSEALRLTREDVHLDRGEIFIRNGKGGKSRSVYVCKECLDAIRALLKVRPECDHEYLLAYNKRYGLMYHGLSALLDDLHT